MLSGWGSTSHAQTVQTVGKRVGPKDRTGNFPKKTEEAKRAKREIEIENVRAGCEREHYLDYFTVAKECV